MPALTGCGIFVEPPANALAERPGPFRPEVDGKDRELVAANAPDDVADARLIDQHRADAPEHRIAHRMAERVIDRLELVDADQHQAHRALEAGPVQDTGEVIAIPQRVCRLKSFHKMRRQQFERQDHRQKQDIELQEAPEDRLRVGDILIEEHAGRWISCSH